MIKLLLTKDKPSGRSLLPSATWRYTM